MSRRLTKADLRQRRQVRKVRARELRERLRDDCRYLLPPPPPQHNGICQYESIAAEQQDRLATTVAMLSQMRRYLPVLLQRLRRIRDPRNPRKVTHSLTMVMLYGIVMFAFQMASRREANREMTRPQFLANLKLFFPELEKLPHQDTMWRLLETMAVAEIASAQVDLIQWLMTKKKFHQFLFNKAYVLAIDGTQKLTSRQLWDTVWQTRTRDGEVLGRYVYVVEASLVLRNGLVVPLMSEFLTPEEVTLVDGLADDKVKQDCEQNAARRLLLRIKERFPRLRLLVTLDGLYANGPMMRLLRELSWDFMIVLKDGSLPAIWEDFEGLQKIERDHVVRCTWRNRRQCYHWSNGMDHEFLVGSKHFSQKVNLVVCEESWEEIAENGAEVTRTTRYAWVSERPLTHATVAARCNEGGRRRWGIESEFLIEKHRGYHYEHAYSYSAQAMIGYHYLMRIAVVINTLIRHSLSLARQVQELGHQGLIKFVVGTLSGPWFQGHEATVVFAMAQPLRLSFG